MKRSAAKNRRGFLLMEAMMATVILAVAAVGVVDLLLSAKEQELTLQQTSTASLLAKQLMEEIAAKPFGLATPVVPRAQMTCANQYNGYQDKTTAISTLSGETIAPGDGEVYTRLVKIINAPVTAGLAAPPSDLQQVTVTVTTPSGQIVSLNRLLTNVTWP